MIVVKKNSESEFVVIVEEKGSSTKHAVTLDDAYYKNLTKGNISKEKLIKKSFKFLLEREPKESILPKFNIKIIKSYFPEYEKEMKKLATV